MPTRRPQRTLRGDRGAGGDRHGRRRSNPDSERYRERHADPDRECFAVGRADHRRGDRAAAFAVCKACHSIEPGKNGIGPSLAGVFGAKAGVVPGFEFSDAMKNSGLTFNQATLERYLTDPRGVVPGTKMAFGGVADAAKRQAIIDY
jgi:cytochrome c2